MIYITLLSIRDITYNITEKPILVPTITDPPVHSIFNKCFSSQVGKYTSVTGSIWYRRELRAKTERAADLAEILFYRKSIVQDKIPSGCFLFLFFSFSFSVVYYYCRQFVDRDGRVRRARVTCKKTYVKPKSRLNLEYISTSYRRGTAIESRRNAKSTWIVYSSRFWLFFLSCNGRFRWKS